MMVLAPIVMVELGCAVRWARGWMIVLAAMVMVPVRRALSQTRAVLSMVRRDGVEEVVVVVDEVVEVEAGLGGSEDAGGAAVVVDDVSVAELIALIQ